MEKKHGMLVSRHTPCTMKLTTIMCALYWLPRTTNSFKFGHFPVLIKRSKFLGDPSKYCRCTHAQHCLEGGLKLLTTSLPLERCGSCSLGTAAFFLPK